MLRLIEGGFLSGAHEKINEEILLRTKAKKKTVLIVPEQQTVVSEAELTRLLPDYAPLYFEATNFTRFANTVFRSLGGVAKSYCTKSHKALIMWKALTELSDEISLTQKKKEVGIGTVNAALMAIADMHSLGISTEDLEKAEELVGSGNPRLKSKIDDLTKIMSRYKRLLREKYDDADDDLGATVEKLLENRDFLTDTAIYIESFSSFTEAQYKLISTLAGRCEVTVHITLPKANPDAFEFTSPKITLDRLRKECAKNISPDSVRLDGKVGGSEFLADCGALLWRSEGEADTSLMREPDEIRIYEAKNPYEECDFIAADIRRLVNEGKRYRDFAIVARRAEDYQGIIDASLADAKIPYFMSKKREASTFEAIKLIYTAFAAVIGGMRREDVISYAKCLPSGITRDACDEFELYCETWQISGNRFTAEAKWRMNPDGYTVERDSQKTNARAIKKRALNEALLESVNDTKERIVTPLKTLSAEIGKAKTVRDYASALVIFMQKIELEDLIKAQTKKLKSINENEAADENEALLTVIPRALDVTVDALGDTEIDRDSFLSLLKVVFSEAEISRIPSLYDSVTVGSADMIRLREKKYVYMIGVNHGEFPPTQSESSYFTDRERATLEEFGMKIQPELESRGAQELYFFSRAFSYASHGLTLIYTLSNAQFAPSRPADVIGRIEAMTGGRISARKISDELPEELIYTPTVALRSLGSLSGDTYRATREALSDAGYGDKVAVAEGRIENANHTLRPDTRSLIYKRDLALTQSRIDAYNECPLSYFCRYNLSLAEEEVAEFDARSIGTLIHAILENFFRTLLNGKISIASLTEEMKVELVKRSAKAFLDELDKSIGIHSEREALLLDRLCRSAMPVVDGLCDEFSSCKFLPAYFELHIQKDSDDLPAPATFKNKSGGEIFVYGDIDRVDTYKSESGELYVRVIDYKTGSKVFSPSDIDKGKNLQMFLYLKSIVDTENGKFLKSIGVEEGKRPLPAGVIYVKTEIGDVRISSPRKEIAYEEIMKAQARLGMLLNDDDSLSAMNSKYVPIKYTSKGAIDGSYKDRLYTLSEWDDICARLENTVTGIADRMMMGDITASAIIDVEKDTPCKYCNFKAFCRNVKS